MTTNLYTFFPKENDAKIADAVLELFRKRDQIDIFNKKALYIYIHEMVPEAKTPKITKIANVLYDVFKKHYVFYLENGYINF
jgi:ribulose kinase